MLHPFPHQRPLQRWPAKGAATATAAATATGYFATHFATRSGLSLPPAGVPPAGGLRIGGYCFKATCRVDPVGGSTGAPVATVTGYDTSPAIGADTERACRLHVRGMRGRRYQCGAAAVTLLPNHSENLECSGQVFFTMDSETKQLV